MHELTNSPGDVRTEACSKGVGAIATQPIVRVMVASAAVVVVDALNTRDEDETTVLEGDLSGSRLDGPRVESSKFGGGFAARTAGLVGS